ncbi:MAG: ATP-binding protein [Bacteroidota bacterium]|jgi:signal transduction histidine kinase
MIQLVKESTLIDLLFPFYFIADKQLKIMKTGKSLSRFIQEETSFEEAFDITSPTYGVEYTCDSIASNASKVFILSLRKNKNNLSIKGQFIPLHDQSQLLFVGAPIVSSEEEMKKNNLLINDFASHDSQIELLHQISALKKAQQRSEEEKTELLKRNDALLHLNKEIEIKNNELRKINAELDNFVYCVSHDLRSPLLSIKGLLALVFNAYDLSIDVDKYLRMAENSINRLDLTIQEILEYSRNARRAVNYEWFDMRNLALEIFHDLQMPSDIPLQFIPDMPQETKIYSDKSRVSVLLRNLFSNAVKFRRTEILDPRIGFSMSIHNNHYQFVVSDNGIGMQDDILKRIFEMFYRGSSALPGTGLGLYISKEVLNKLGGDIYAESTMGMGTNITFTLPIQQA